MNFIDLSQDDTPGHQHDVIDLLDDGSTELSSPNPTTRRRSASDPDAAVSWVPHNGYNNDSDQQQRHQGPVAKKSRRQAPQQPCSPELQVLEVFPDADMEELRTILQHFQNSVPQVLSYMADKPYKKSTKMTVPTAERTRHWMGGNDDKNNNETVWKYNYLSTESFAPSTDYVEQATDQLLSDFHFLSKTGARGILRMHSNHYAVSHEKIWTAVKGTGEEDVQYDRVMTALEGRGRKVPSDLVQRVKQICGGTTSSMAKTAILQTSRKQSCKAIVSNAILLEETRFVRDRVREWIETQRQRRARAERQRDAQAQGTALECGCCFDSYPIEDMVACRNEGHLFCMDCLKLYAENQIFGQGNLGIDKRTKRPALELFCCYGGEEGCTSGFHRSSLEKALPPKTLKKYDEVQFTVSIQQAGLISVCSCPKCGYQADVPDTQRIFSCPVAECGFVSCRECGEVAHIPLRCDEVEKEIQTKGRLTVEEAISEAVIRKCPKCKKPIIKSDGCNKVRCACGAFMCYICQQAIKDYTHFCQTPHCTHQNNSCKKCPLYTKAEEDDARAMREAGYAAAERVKQESTANRQNNRNSAEVDVDVEGILRAK